MSDKVIRREVMRCDDPYGIPACFFWTLDDVLSWLQSIGYGKYMPHFANHGVNGKKLLTVDACILPRMGVTDFCDILDLAGRIRNLLCSGRRTQYKPPALDAAFQDIHFYEHSPLDGLHPEYEYFLWYGQAYRPHPVNYTHPEFLASIGTEPVTWPEGRRF